MNTTQRYKLIDGTFTATEATQVLLSLVKSKIDYHNLEKLSNEERFGRDVSHSGRRLAELQQLHETLRAVCRSAASAGQRMRVNGWIEIELVPARVETEAPARATATPNQPSALAPQTET